MPYNIGMYDWIEKSVSYSLNEECDDDIVKVGLALSCKTRINMLRLINNGPMTITELSHKLFISASATLFHVKLLEDAGFVRTDRIAGKKKDTRLIVTMLRKVSLDLTPQNTTKQTHKEEISFEMPIGLYTDACYDKHMGVIVDGGVRLGEVYSPERVNAYVMWIDNGYAEYAFPCKLLNDKRVTELYVTLEICAEAPHYRNDWKSDITFSLNGKEIGMYTSPSDFGGKRGRLNPAWWSDDGTQYGQLIKIEVNEQGSYINGIRVGDVTLKDIDIKNKDKCVLRIENKADAKNAGGFNLFSKRFGDYEQDIILTAVYETDA